MEIDISCMALAAWWVWALCWLVRFPGLGASAGQIFAVVVERGGSLHDGGNHALQALLHAVHGVAEIADLIVSAADDGLAGEIAFGDRAGALTELAEAGDETAGGQFEPDQGNGASDHRHSPEGDGFGAVEAKHLGEAARAVEAIRSPMIRRNL